MKISFSVLTFNSSKVLSACLDAILKEVSFNGNEYEINVLNNGSSDNTKEIILRKTGNINYFENEVNLSFTNGFNKLLSNASGDVYCIMSDDVIISEGILGYISTFYSKLDNNKTVLAPQTFLPDGRLDRINKKELNEIDLIFGYTIIGTFFKRTGAEYDQAKSCNAEVVQDSCLFFENSIKNHFVFDERYKFYFTEDSLSINLRKATCKLRYETAINVNHFLKQATKKSKNIKMNTIYTKDCITYSRRNLNPLFHIMIFVPLVAITYSLKYIKWRLKPDHYI